MSDLSSEKPVTVVSSSTAQASGAAFVKGIGRAFSKPPDDHPIYSLIGQVSSDWAHLEHILDQIIWSLAGIDAPHGACITAQFMSIWPRYNAIKALLIKRAESKPEFSNFMPSLKKLSSDSQKTSEDRNRIVHDPWYADVGDGQAAQLRSMPRSDPIYGLLDRERDEILATLKGIDQLSVKATRLKNQIATAMVRSQ